MAVTASLHKELLTIGCHCGLLETNQRWGLRGPTSIKVPQRSYERFPRLGKKDPLRTPSEKNGGKRGKNSQVGGPPPHTWYLSIASVAVLQGDIVQLCFMISFWQTLKEIYNPIIFVNLIYRHFDILMAQYGRAKKVMCFRAVPK